MKTRTIKKRGATCRCNATPKKNHTNIITRAMACIKNFSEYEMIGEVLFFGFLTVFVFAWLFVPFIAQLLVRG